jgi:hypothetical protein
MRPAWSSFIRQLAGLTLRSDGRARFARGNQYLRDAGVFYRQYSADPMLERDWPLSHIPVILHESDWDEICAGLAQRAELLERVVADLYGAGQLVRDGHLPASLIAQNPEWHRPLVGIAARVGAFPAPSGLRDRAQSGRVVAGPGRPDAGAVRRGLRAGKPDGDVADLSRTRAARKCARLAGFFRAFRDAMDALPGAEGRRSAILSPGPATTPISNTPISRGTWDFRCWKAKT